MKDISQKQLFFAAAMQAILSDPALRQVIAKERKVKPHDKEDLLNALIAEAKFISELMMRANV
jgi:hypothetical protein